MLPGAGLGVVKFSKHPACAVVRTTLPTRVEWEVSMIIRRRSGELYIETINSVETYRILLRQDFNEETSKRT
jgi:hypothetical protein